MTYEGAKATILLEYCGADSCEDCDNCVLGKAIEALEKQVPKTPNYEGDGYWDGELVYDTWFCPNCGKDYEVDYDDYKYCPECGQAIDWSDEV